MKLETSLRKVREVVTRPENFHFLSDLDSPEDYTPNPTAIYFKLDEGLVYYEPHGVTVEMFSALSKLPKKPVSVMHEQWEYLSEMGFHTVYAKIRAGHKRAMAMCAAAGMERRYSEPEYNIYTKVIYGVNSS